MGARQMTWSLLTLNSLSMRHSRSHQRSAEFVIVRPNRIQVLRTGGVVGAVLCRCRRDVFDSAEAFSQALSGSATRPPLSRRVPLRLRARREPQRFRH